MKSKLFVALIALTALTVKSYGQFSFGVSPGIGLNSAYFGYKINDKIVPFIGFQYMNAKFKYKESGHQYSNDLNQIISYSEKNEFSGSLYIPNIGVKYFMKNENKLKTYLSLSLSKPFVSGKLSYDGEEEEEFNDQVKSIKMFGGEFGFGVEYFFDENFSIGGEFGIRYLKFKYDQSYDDEIYNPDIGDYQDSETNYDYKLNMSPTYSKVSLNYYF